MPFASAMAALDSLMTVKEVCSMLRVSPQTLYKMLEVGSIPALRVGNQWRFERQRVLEWIARGGASSDQPSRQHE